MHGELIIQILYLNITFNTLHVLFLADNLYVTVTLSQPLVKSSFKLTVCYSRDFTVLAQMKVNLLFTQHSTVPIFPSIARTFSNCS